QFAFLEFRVGGDDGLALPYQVCAFFEDGSGFGQGVADHLQRRERAWGGSRGVREGAGEGVAAREENFPFVGEVPVERPFGEPGAGGDLRNGGGVEALVVVELQRGLLQAASCVGFPAAHPPILSAMTETDIQVMTVTDISVKVMSATDIA